MTTGDLMNPVKTKRMMAEQFAHVGNGSGMGSTIDQILIKDRNKVALRIMGKELNDGKKNVGLFYGAAHCQDFHRRLVKFGFTASEPRWQTAWNLTEGGLSGAVDDFQRHQDFQEAIEPIKKIKIN